MEQEKSYKNTGLTALKDIIGPVDYYAEDDGFYVSASSLSGRREIIPNDFNGVVFCICLQGNYTISLNDSEFNVGPNTIFAVPTNLRASMSCPEEGDKAARILVIAISGKYFFDLKIDIGDVLKQMRFDGFTERRAAPYTRIEEEECTILAEHIKLISSLYNSNVRAKKDNYTLLMSSTVNVLYKAVTDKMRSTQKVRLTSVDSARTKSVFTEFMNLAVTHFEKERSIAFYANEMCLTPKYLSKLVKENCGRTASDIIDSMVIAKTNNLLKHSDKSVKVIASEMGFSSQSAFNKFFKAKTGMSPLQYRSE